MLKTNYIGFHRWFEHALNAADYTTAETIIDIGQRTLDGFDRDTFNRMAKRSLAIKKAAVLDSAFLNIPFQQVC